MNKKFELIIIFVVIIIIGSTAVGISTQIQINRIIQHRTPQNNYSSSCNEEENSECEYIKGFQPYCCKEDENNSNYESP